MKFELELDIPYTEVIEPGFAYPKLLKQARFGDGFDRERFYFEKETGTLMLRPYADLDDLWGDDTRYQAGRIPQAQLQVRPGMWEELAIKRPAARFPGGSVVAVTRYHNAPRAGRPTATQNRTEDLAVPGVDWETLPNGAELVPLAKTSADLRPNDGFYCLFFRSPSGTVCGRYFCAVQFGGSWLVAIGHDGVIELWERSGASWVRRHSFDARRVAMDPATLLAPFWSLSLHVQPFGRGNILLGVRAIGAVARSVYHVRTATYDGATQTYSITSAGPVILYQSRDSAHRLFFDLHRLRFPEQAYWRDEAVSLPYPPTQPLNGSVSWARTFPQAQLAYNWLDAYGAPWQSNGENSAVQLEMVLSGDGTCTPYVDAYAFQFPAKVVRRQGDPWRIGPRDLLELRIADGLEDADQQLEFAMRVNTASQRHLRLMTRHEIRGRLLVDGETHSYWLLERPRTTVASEVANYTVVRMEGRNLGHSLLAKRRFLKSQPYDNMTHTEAIRQILLTLGWSPEELELVDDGIRLPGVEERTAETADWKMLPRYNTPVAEFVRMIVDNYSGWPLEFRRDGKWHYAPREFPAAPRVTFYRRRTDAAGRYSPAHWPWYEGDLEFEPEAPEANWVVVLGRDDRGQIIGRQAIDWTGIRDPADNLWNPVDAIFPQPPPSNYVGRVKPLVYVDPALNSMDAVTRVLERLFERTRRAVGRVRWRGPFVPALQPGDGVLLEGYVLVQLESYSFQSGGRVHAEHGPSTVYTGRYYYESR